MALFFADLVREASWGTGAGDLPLEGALPGHRRFVDAVPPGARFHYCIAGVTHPEEWETGEGEIGGGTLVRLPLASSAGGAAVSFSLGLKSIALTVAADWFAAREAGIDGGADLAELQAALDGKAPSVHGHSAADVAGLQTALNGKASELHGHTVGDVTGLQAALDAKASAVHGHGITDVTGLQGALDAKLDGSQATPFGRSLLDDDDAAAGRATLALGTIATQNANNVSVTGGTISGLTNLSVSGAASATSYIDAGGAVRATGLAAPSSGSGLELLWTGTTSQILSLDRTASARLPLQLDCSSFDFRINSTVATLSTTGFSVTGTLNSSGALTVSSGGATITDALTVTGTGSFTDNVSISGQKCLTFGDTGAGAPTLTSRSAGTKLLLFEALSGSTVDYALGIESSTMWFSVSGSTRQFKWYAGTANIATLTGSGNFSVTGALAVGGSQVVTSRRTGWSAPTGTATRTAFATSNVTTAQLAERVKALIDDLTAHGLIGS